MSASVASARFLERCREVTEADRHKRSLRIVATAAPVSRCRYCGTPHPSGAPACQAHDDLPALERELLG